MYPLFETIKIQEGIVYNLQYHIERLKYSYRNYYGTEPPFLSGLKTELIQTEIPENYKQGLIKLKLIYNKFGYKYEFSVYKPRAVHTLKIVQAETIDYSLKYTDRSEIDKLFSQRDNCDDILIIQNGMPSDTSIANIVFFDGTDWITPANALLKGTCRENYIKNGTIKEKNILLEDLKNFESFYLINAMLYGSKNILPIKNIVY